MTKPVVHHRLVNWGRYWRDSDGRMGRCMSLEHKYLPEVDSRLAADRLQETKAGRMPAPNMLDAVLVNEAWKRCSREAKDVLKFSYCFGKVNDDFICQRARIRKEALQLRFSRAVAEIARLLDAPRFIDTIRPDNSRTSSDKSHPSDFDETVAPSADGPSLTKTQ